LKAIPKETIFFCFGVPTDQGAWEQPMIEAFLRTKSLRTGKERSKLMRNKRRDPNKTGTSDDVSPMEKNARDDLRSNQNKSDIRQQVCTFQNAIYVI